MLSMPPATTTSASPARISAAASMIAFSPEPQTRLIVVALVVTGSPAAERRLAGRCLADAGLEHLAHEDLVDRRPVRQAAPLDGRADGDPAELDRGHLGERAGELADRRPRRAHEKTSPLRAVERVDHQRVRGMPRSIFEVPGSGQR